MTMRNPEESSFFLAMSAATRRRWENFLVGRIRLFNAWNCLFGNYEDVGGGLWVKIVNGDAEIVFMLNFGWDLPIDDLFEYSFLHHTWTICSFVFRAVEEAASSSM